MCATHVHVNDRPIFDIGPVVGEDPSDTGPDIGVPGVKRSGDRDLQQVRERTPAETDRRRGLLLSAAVILAALVALIAVPLLTRGGDEQATPTDERAEADDSLPSVLGDDRIAAASETSDPTMPERTSPEQLRADEVAWLFESEIDGDAEIQFGIAYVANDDLVVLDHRGITVADLEIAVDFATVANLALLTNDGRTWAINPDNRDLTYLVSNSYVVVVSERPGTIAVIRPDDQSEIGMMSSALPKRLLSKTKQPSVAFSGRRFGK